MSSILQEEVIDLLFDLVGNLECSGSDPSGNFRVTLYHQEVVVCEQPRLHQLLLLLCWNRQAVAGPQLKVDHLREGFGQRLYLCTDFRQCDRCLEVRLEVCD